LSVLAALSLRCLSVLAALSLRCLSAGANGGKVFRMSEVTHKNMSREERLAAKLRENLRRRKSQGRAMSAQSGESGEESLSKEGERS
jgi:hypothetical protein